MRENDPISKLLNQVNPQKVRQYNHALKRYNINTIGQLYGALHPLLPRLNRAQAKNKALSSNFFKAVEKVNDVHYQTKSLKKLLNAPLKEINEIEKLLNSVKMTYCNLKNNDSVMSLGCKTHNQRFRTSFWSNSPKASFHSSGLFVIPNYRDLGSVFQQGERGTCVANATVTLLDYLSRINYSRQFLYHQCKMIDGIPNQQGTFLGIAAKALSMKVLKDYGCVKENLWEYNPIIGSSEHQGPPPERCFNAKRFVGKEAVYVRKSNIINDILTLLSGSNQANPVPVVIGVTLFSSFNNYSSQRTGWITMPLPGEQISGGHAMLIVGYDYEKKLFLVRNSWGVSWASANEWGYSGHAIIPFAYIQKYADAGFSIIKHDIEDFDVAEKHRLYNNKMRLESGRLAATKKKKSNTRQQKSKAKKKKKSFWSKFF